MQLPSAETLLADFKPPFARALGVRNIQIANLVAMEAASVLVQQDTENGRLIAWKEFFEPLARRYRAQYQCYDFEVADYELYPIPQSWSLLRGPRPALRDLADGRYATFVGAAQLFGRFQRVAPHTVISGMLGVPCLNLSVGGAGPESFFRDEVVEIINDGRALVLQMLSGRSVGCDEYPGTRRTFRPENPDVKIDRLTLLEEIWDDSRKEAQRLVAKWQRRYVEMMTSFLAQIKVPVVLTWISVRKPEDWHRDCLESRLDFGAFPQLVDAEMFGEVARLCSQAVAISGDLGLPYEFNNRFTGEKCPVLRPNGSLQWRNEYYPSALANSEFSRKIADALKAAF